MLPRMVNQHMTDATPKLATCEPGVRTVTGWTIVLMVLLRISIGWHLFYEGIWKLNEGNWTATSYLVASAGPLRPFFRWMVPDVDGLEALKAESIHKRIDERYAVLTKHYGMDPKTLEGPEKYHKAADAILAAPDFQMALAAYAARVKDRPGDPDFQPELIHTEVYQMLQERDFPSQAENYADLARRTSEMSGRIDGLKATPHYEVERLSYDYRKKAQARAALTARLEKPLTDMEAEFAARASEKQLALGPPPREKSPTFLIDWANMLGLTLAGACLMLGLFTRFAALSGAGLLALYYACQPPFPGLPEVPNSEGHYLIVNKNLIEFLMLLMLATSRVGRWGGLDAYLSRLFCRKSAVGGAGNGPVVVAP